MQSRTCFEATDRGRTFLHCEDMVAGLHFSTQEHFKGEDSTSAVWADVKLRLRLGIYWHQGERSGLGCPHGWEINPSQKDTQRKMCLWHLLGHTAGLVLS